MKNKISTFFKENTESSQIDYSYFAEQFLAEYDFEQEFDAQSFIDGFKEYLDDQNAFDVEITYYTTAIEYLAANDTSLHESLALAANAGYEVKNLSSEVLASLLASQQEREDFDDIESDFISEIAE